MRFPFCRQLVASFIAGLAVACAPSALAQATSQPYTWKNVAIKGGGFVTGLVYHPTARDLLYARTDVGGAFRWNAGEQRWVPLNDALGRDDSQLTGVLSIGLDPSDAQRVYLACGQYTQSWASTAALLASTDQGATWKKTTLPFKLGGNEDGRGTGERLQVDPNDGRILIVGTTSSGLWRSADRGTTWTRLASFTPTAVSLVVFDGASGSVGAATPTIYVGAAGSGAGLYRSTDGGTTWTLLGGQPTGVIPLHAKLSSDRLLYVSFSDSLGPNNATKGSVWRFDSAGAAWTNITPPTGQGGFSGVSLDAKQPNVVLVSTLDRWSPRDELYYSTDRGASWTAVMPKSTLDTSPAPYAASLTPHWITDVEIDPNNSDRAWFVTGYGVFTTTGLAGVASGSITWVFRDEGLEETVPLGLAAPPTGATLFSAIGDFDGFRHTDLDTSPAAGRLKPSYGTNTSVDFAELAPAIMVRTLSSSPRALLSKDGGVTWTPFAAQPPTVGNGTGSIAVGADGKKLVWSPARSIPYYSADDGATWTAATGVPDPGSATFVAVAERTAANTFYIHDTVGGRLYASTNGGATFTTATTLPAYSDPVKSMPGYPLPVLWVASPNGLWMSAGSASSFALQNEFSAAYRVGFGKGKEGAGYPAVYVWARSSFTGEGIYRSESFGGLWTRITDADHQFGWINAIAGDANVFGRVYLATGGRGVMRGDISSTSLLPASDFAAFTVGVNGSYQPIPTRTSTGVTYSATNLPAWAQLNASTGAISGTPTDPAGTLRQITLTANEGVFTASSMTLNLFVASAGNDLSVVNLSARAPVGTGGNILIPGISVSGAGSRTFLIRAVGPTLTQFGLDGVLANPQLTVVPLGSTTTLAANDNWETQTVPSELETMRTVGTAKGAFPLTAGGKDAALLAALSAGSYTAKVEGVGGGTGIALLEVYDVTSTGGTAQLSNISVRAVAGSGGSILIAGITLDGNGARRVLVRGVGPTLGLYGVAGVLPDPQLTLSRLAGNSSTVLATSGAWSANPAAADFRTAAQTVQAFALPEGSNDAAMLPLLVAGSYTIGLSSQSGQSGAALIEVYLLP